MIKGTAGAPFVLFNGPAVYLTPLRNSGGFYKSSALVGALFLDQDLLFWRPLCAKAGIPARTGCHFRTVNAFFKRSWFFFLIEPVSSVQVSRRNMGTAQFGWYCSYGSCYLSGRR